MKQAVGDQSSTVGTPASRGQLSWVRWDARTSNAIMAGAILVAYVALEWISFIHEQKGLPVTPWNPGLGVVFAVMVLRGPTYGLLLFAGVVIAEIFVLQSELNWPVIIGIGATVSSGYAFMAVVARRHLQLDVELTHPRDVFVLLLAGIAGAALVAVLLTLLLLVAGQLDARDITQAVVPLFVGDIIGIAVVTPLVLRLALRWGKVTRAQLLPLAPEIALYVVVITFAIWMILGTASASSYKFFYLLFLPVVIAAVRHGLDGACLSLAVTQLGLVGLLHRYGYDATAFTEFQALMFVLTTTGLLVGVVVSERQQADRAAREAEARLEEKEAEAAQAARFNMVSGMASALAHEINQPMTAARALARSAQQILRTPNADLSRADGNLTTLVAQIDHAGSVVRRMREFLRRGGPHFSTLDVKTMLENALALVRSEAAANQIRIDLEVSGALPAIYGDRIQLQQVVLNLVRNAMEAIIDSRRTDGRVQLRAQLSAQLPHVEISVMDNGTGLDAEHASGLFEPLTTTKQEGLGLGLSISASIVQAHGGRIWLQSSKAGATEFRFSVPLEQPRSTQE